mgnify:FL=1
MAAGMDGHAIPKYRWGPLRVLELVRALLELLWLLVCIRLKSASVRATAGAVAPPWAGMADELATRAAQTPDARALVSTASGEALTFRELDELSNQVAHWLIVAGICPGDVVPIVRCGCPRYVALWLGVAKARATAALINAQLRGGALLHALRVALDGTPSARHLIVCDRDALDELARAGVRSVFPDAALFEYACARCALAGGGGAIGESGGAARATSDGVDGALDLERLLCAQPSRAPDAGGGTGDARAAGGALALIYTSGTTGLPKASRFSHLRCWMAGKAAHVLCRLGPTDRLYCALPLHHASGGMLAVSAAILSGACLLIPERFSASSFLDDCALHGATAVQYIGEMARYVVASERDGGAAGGKAGRGARAERGLRVRVALGNGLQPRLWEPFRAALGGARIVEFYASTEGNVNLFNNTGRTGAVGIVPSFVPFAIYPILLARVGGGAALAERERADVERADAPGAERGAADAGAGASLALTRDARGLCIPCAPHEPGQLLGLIRADDPLRAFDGYTDERATASKVARGVRRAGDAWFASGDLLARDRFGFYFWVDRAGDTFRWKGENASTAEVAGALALADGIADATVFGARVPGCEGRAGMAAIELHASAHGRLDGAALFRHCEAELPPYARPLFVRVLRADRGGLALTGTFKHQKGALEAAGWDLAMADGDTLLVRDDALRTFTPLTAGLARDLELGRRRV